MAKKKPVPTKRTTKKKSPEGSFVIEAVAPGNFGFEFQKKSQKQKDKTENKSFVAPDLNDGSLNLDIGQVAYGTYLDIEGLVRNEYELISRYRNMANYPDCDKAVDNIVNEAIVGDEDKPPVSIVLDDVEDIGKALKDEIRDEFDQILRLIDFNNSCYDLFRRWYVDGRLYFHKIIDEDSPKEGIQEVRYIDPRQIRKVREIHRVPDKNGSQAPIVDSVKEYYLFSPRGIQTGNQHVGTKISTDAICFVHSGVPDPTHRMIVSHLHKAIKPLNQLRMIEDALVIYRLSRAASRRIFYIDVGDLPKSKAEQYLKSIMNQYRNKLVYDSQTGEIRDDKRHLSMMEDFWLPRRNGNSATEISTLDGNTSFLSDINDVTIFQKQLYVSLNVPLTRLQADTGFTLGRATEITRDEITFGKFVSRLRKRFTHLFDDLLCTQLILKGICTRDDWEQMKEFIHYDFLQDTYFGELKEAEIMRDRLAMLQLIQPYEGTYFSRQYVRTQILKQTEDEIEEMDKQIAEEKDKYTEEMEGNPGMGATYAGTTPDDYMSRLTMHQTLKQSSKDLSGRERKNEAKKR